jgi:hypothetical protein
MITDVFYERYKTNDTVLKLNHVDLTAPLNQGYQIVANEGAEILKHLEGTTLVPGLRLPPFRLEQLSESAHKRICRELGWDELNSQAGAVARCKAAITLAVTAKNFAKHGPQHMLAITVLEQLFYALERAVIGHCDRINESCSKMEELAKQIGPVGAPAVLLRGLAEPSKMEHARKMVAWAKSALNTAIDELNLRMSRAGIPLAYHSGLFQITDQGVMATKVVEPFWRTFSDPKWSSVVTDFQEALDRRDSGDRDATKYAFMGLESVAKVLSEENQRTTGKENGFANWLGNLVREVNGVRILDQWESEILIKLNGEARNIHSHGPGAAPHPTKTPAQVDACIWTAMAWAQSLAIR